MKKRSSRRSDSSNPRQAGIDSIETGIRLLVELAKARKPQMLKTLAEEAGMPPAKAHRYFVSLIRTGLVDRDPESSRYRLGPVSMQIGLAALSSADAIQFAAQAMLELRDTLDLTVSLAVWGTHGPTILRIDEASQPVPLNARPGTVLPILSSASGQVFAAFLPDVVFTHILADELKVNRGRANANLIRSPKDAAVRLEEVRRQGLGRVSNELLPGIRALAAPIFDHRSYPIVALAIMGPSESLDVSSHGKPAKLLQGATQRVSARLGYNKEQSSDELVIRPPIPARR